MKTTATIALVVCLCGGTAGATEGMWRPEQLPGIAADLEAAGLAIDPAGLSRLTEHPMGAVIDLGGCTASFVSPQGLVVTNHHCAWGSLQYNSTPERNLLDDGFLAGSPAEELAAAPGSRVRVTVEVRDVTAEVTAGLGPGLEGAERHDRIEARQKELVAACERDEGHRCRVSSFYGGLEYQLFKQLEIRDVRLVYAPPGSIGVFGGDQDNWMWPRHTGDFAFLRAYVGPDGKPADPGEDNVPYRPRHWLRVAERGVEADDFVMIVGYPGRTQRYRLGSEVDSAFAWSYPTRKAALDDMLALYAREAEARPEVAITYAATIAGLNNASKNYQGMIDGYARSGMLERRRAREAALQAWIDADPVRKAEHASTLADLEALIRRDQETRERDLVLGMLGRAKMLSTARSLYRLGRERELPDERREPGYQERDMTPFRERLQRIDRRYDPQTDRAVLRLLLDRYRALPTDQRIPELDAFLELDDPAGLDARLDRMYAATGLGDGAARLRWMEADRAAFEASEDPFLRLAVALHDGDREREAEAEAEALQGEFQRARSRYMEALLAFLAESGRMAYPDANSSLRVTYGRVRGYSPRDGIVYTPFTRLEGISEKSTGVKPFDAPAVALARIAAGDHGRYRLDALRSVPVNFLSTVDTTGGNSGSPTLNGRGELVGLLFDGTYDSINSDWDFNERTTRSIHVDLRYALWVMEKVDGAARVLEELRP